jgi:hypothetical protein
MLCVAVWFIALCGDGFSEAERDDEFLQTTLDNWRVREETLSVVLPFSILTDCCQPAIVLAL